MKFVKNTMTILIVFLVALMVLSSTSNAATANVGASSSKVTVREKYCRNSFF